jgi:hypothetical protein
MSNGAVYGVRQCSQSLQQAYYWPWTPSLFVVGFSLPPLLTEALTHFMNSPCCLVDYDTVLAVTSTLKSAARPFKSSVAIYVTLRLVAIVVQEFFDGGLCPNNVYFFFLVCC